MAKVFRMKEPEENIIAIRNRSIDDANAAFADFMQKTENCFNQRSKNDPLLYKGVKPSDLECITEQLLKEIAPSTPFNPDDIQLISGHRFPDIVANHYYGVEVKSTKENKWTSTGSSIVESTRIDDVDNIYMLFGKLGGTPLEFRCRPYQECLSDIAVTHSPRYLIDMTLPNNGNIFSKMGKDYDAFWKMSENDKISEVRKFYHQKAKSKGKYEMPWWMGGATSINLSFYSDADDLVKEQLFVRAFALFFSMYDNNPQNRYKQLSLWLCTHYSLLHPNIRDLFTAGGVYKYTYNSKTVDSPHIVGELLNRSGAVKELLNNPDEVLLRDIEDFWDFKYDKKDLYNSWLARLENAFICSNELKEIPIRKLIEEKIG